MIGRLLRALLRRYYAAVAMPVLLQAQVDHSAVFDSGRVARLAFNVADAMVAEPRRRELMGDWGDAKRGALDKKATP